MSRKRVLVVDDDDLNLKLMQYLLATEDCDVVTALDAKQARAELRREKPDLVLLDLQLPDISGLELIRRLRAAGSTVDVMAISAGRDSESVRVAVAQGAVQYLIKPFAFVALRDKLMAYRMMIL